MRRVIFIFSFIVAVGLVSGVSASPTPATKGPKPYYSSPIREFRGAAFFQWKKHEVATVATEKTPAKDSVQQTPKTKDSPTRATASAKN